MLALLYPVSEGRQSDRVRAVKRVIGTLSRFSLSIAERWRDISEISPLTRNQSVNSLSPRAVTLSVTL